ncbi:MAG: hypothetical protein ACOC1P_05020 [Minisyncoccales bacterium]
MDKKQAQIERWLGKVEEKGSGVWESIQNRYLRAVVLTTKSREITTDMIERGQYLESRSKGERHHIEKWIYPRIKINY